MVNDIISDWEAVRARVWHHCLSTLDAAEVVIPPEDAPERTVYVVLPPQLLDDALSVGEALKEFIESVISAFETYLSRLEVNLLRGGVAEIEQYVMQDRPGSDVSTTLYKEFYRSELQELLDDEASIIRNVVSRQGRKGATRKPYWQRAPLTIGVEEEYQVVSADTFELVQGVDQFLGKVKLPNAELSGEVYRSQLELKTGICESVDELRIQLTTARRALAESLPDGLRIVSAGTHPFSTWNAQEAQANARTEMFMHDMQEVVRRLVIFGLHVHVGVEDRELALAIMDAAKQFLPIALGMSASSPFWEGRPTGLMSYRSTIFSALPRTGIPPTFSRRSDFDEYLQLLARTKSFDSAGTYDPTKIWWDVRVHPTFPTLEFRICDACTDVDHAITIAALFQALVGRLAQLAYDGVSLPVAPLYITQENKWRAARYGRRARYIDNRSGRAVGSYYKLLELLDFVGDALIELHSDDVRDQALNIIRHGTSADEQLRIYRTTRSLPDVVRFLADRFAPANRVGLL